MKKKTNIEHIQEINSATYHIYAANSTVASCQDTALHKLRGLGMIGT